MKTPNIINDANVYVDGANWLGKASIEIPEVAHKVVESRMFGQAGGMEVPLKGHIDKLDGKMKFKAMTAEAAAVLYNAARSPLLDVRAAVQNYNQQSGAMEVYPIKITMQGFFKKVKLTELKQGADGEHEAEYAAHYFKLEIDGKEILEIDKFNYIYKVGGVDVLADVRAALGM